MLQTIILVPAIMVIAIVSVVLIRALFKVTHKGDASRQSSGEKWDVEKFTADLNK